MNKLYCFIGVIGSGKDHQCDLLVNSGKFDYKLSIADGVREFFYELFDINPFSNDEYNENKESVVIWVLKKLDKGIDRLNELTFRKMLQNIGKTLRKYKSNFWIDRLIDKMDIWYNYVDEVPGFNICINDVRYKNELKALFDYETPHETKFFFTNYKSDRYNNTDKDVSEQLAQYILNKYNYKEDIQEIPKEIILEIINEYEGE